MAHLILTGLTKACQNFSSKAMENTHHWANKEKLIISCCFSHDAQCTKLAILILLYLGEDLNYALTGAALQAKYRQKNQGDAFKSKPLRIVHIRTTQQHAQLTKTLKVWEQLVEVEHLRLKHIVEKTKYMDVDLFEKTAIWGDYYTILGLIRTNENACCIKTVVINEQSIVEGVSYSKPDPSFPSAYHIFYLLTAPWNLIKRQKSVTGACSALIEYVALQSLKQQGINPEDQLPSSLLKRAAVTLQTTGSARSFYTHLFFVKQPDPHRYLILTGENVLKFFERFGGRAHYDCIEI